MKTIMISLALLLCSCASNYTGIGLGSTKIVAQPYGRQWQHWSFGVGVFSIPEHDYSTWCIGYNATCVSVIDTAKAKMELRELQLVYGE